MGCCSGGAYVSPIRMASILRKPAPPPPQKPIVPVTKKAGDPCQYCGESLQPRAKKTPTGWIIGLWCRKCLLDIGG